MVSGVCADDLRVGTATTALRFFEPITAPTPLRAARRPWSLQMPPMSDMPLAGLADVGDAGALAVAGLEQVFVFDGAGAPEVGGVRNSNLSSSMRRYFGLAALPKNMMPSQPACLRYGRNRRRSWHRPSRR